MRARAVSRDHTDPPDASGAFAVTRPGDGLVAVTLNPVDGADRDWVLQNGSDLTALGPLSGGITSLMLALDLDGRELVLRRIDKHPWLRFAEELLTREAAVMQLLVGTDVPAPELIAVEAPRLLMTRLPGKLEMASTDFDALAQALMTIHSVDARPRPYQSWAAGKRPPAWSDVDLWERAIQEIDRDPPAFAACFIHRDFHLGNVLWQDGEISGVVDWVETSTGPADLDVAHCCTNLAMTHGGEAPQRFRAAYQEAGGNLTDDPYWVLLDAVGFLPGAVDRGPGPGWERLEAYVESSLRASSSRSW
jgi:aminoglycoside phosphotransferase (APT) family kinase protein